MSGLEPLAAMGFACSVLRLVEAGGKIFNIAQTAYQQGTIDRKTAKEYTSILFQLSNEMLSKSATAPAKPAHCEVELLKTAKTCRDVSRDLSEDLTYLDSLASKGELLAAVKLAAKVSWRQRRLKRLEQNLKDVESRMQKLILGRVL
ncbi:uncharacterized protein PgNI_00166 [Pyricularia grisea]|uniref:Fungal N-terminal domain-containing protein n=1 Tax=Pyricularia grisea TaxID=148305 RepID=A0A6P8BJM7_PYRGI|nr:uncharacterized protein PgNI_00166 [Pyricularia grisea]TLD16777.1 hypothetical protein PgNI_00166 [Pyricularia grisea]